MNVTPNMGTVSSQGSASAIWDTLVQAALIVSSCQAVRMGTARRVLSAGVRMAGLGCSVIPQNVTRTVRETMASVLGLASVSAREVTVDQTALSAAPSQGVRMVAATSH